MPSLRPTGVCSRLISSTILIAALLFAPVFALASGGEGGKVQDFDKVAAEHGTLHLAIHEHGIPELANIIDYIRAAMAKVIVEKSEGELEPGKEPNSFVLKDENTNFFDKKVGFNGVHKAPFQAEDMVYSVWILDGPHKGRFIALGVMDNELELEAPVHAGAKKEEKKAEEGPVKVSYVVKEEHTLTSTVYGAGLFSLNWADCTNILFAFITITFLIVLSFLATHKLRKVPKGFQALVEMLVGGLDTFTQGILGAHNKPYLPLVGTLFLYILFMALLGLVPFAKSPIALNYNMPLALALVVFIFVQYHAVRQNGVKGYVRHLMGDPIWLCWLQFPLHILGEFVKPLSLSLRLFANISAEDILVAALVLMMVFLPVFVPVPLQILFFPLALLFSLIQALVFMSLSAVYIAIMFPHEEEHH